MASLRAAHNAARIIGRAGASPPSRTNSMIFLYIYLYIYLFIYIRSTVRRALNLLRASFSPIFQYFSAVNVTRVSFSPVFQYFVTYVYVYTLYIRMPCATELFDVRHGFFGPEDRSRRVSQYMYNYNNSFVKIYSHVKL